MNILTGLRRGMVTMRRPLLITMCLPWRTIRKPAFSSAHGVLMVDAGDLGQGSDGYFDFANVLDAKLFIDDGKVFADRVLDVLQRLVLARSLRPTPREAGHRYAVAFLRESPLEVWFSPTQARSGMPPSRGGSRLRQSPDTAPDLRLTTLRLADMTVNRLGFGAMRVIDNEDIWGEPGDRGHAIRVLRRAVELGVEFFDTAESYGPHTDETLIAEALYPYPKGLVVATKCGLARPRPSRWDADCRPEKLRQDLEGSLKRLRLERIDLYQFHAPDPKVPFAESVGCLAELQRAGKIRHLGLSNVSVKQLEQARRIAPIVSVQNAYNLGDRSSDDVLAACDKHAIAFLPWYPLAAGRSLRLARVKKLAARHRVSAAQVAIAWLLARSPVMLPIPGTGSIAHLEENVAAAALKLPDAELAAL